MDLGATDIGLGVIGLAPAGLLWWLVVRLRSRPQIKTDYRHAVSHAGHVVLTMRIRNEPEYNSLFVFAGVRRESMEDVVLAESVFDVDRGRTVLSFQVRRFHDQSGALAWRGTLVPSGFIGFDFPVIDYDPVSDLASILDTGTGQLIGLAPGLYRYELWLEAHPGARAIKKGFYVIKGGPPQWSSY